jgi:hypothetical protein
MPISKKQIKSNFRDVNDADAHLLSLMIQEAEKQSNDPERQEIIEYANRVVHGHGVEEIRGTKSTSKFWTDAVAVYVNTGDTYTPTILYDTIKRKFYLTDYGSFVEKHDKNYGIAAFDGRGANPSTAEDNTYGRGYYPLPAKFARLGDFVGNLRPLKLVAHRVFVDDKIHLLRAKVDVRLSIMALDMKSLLKLGLVRIQCNEPGTLDFYFQE